MKGLAFATALAAVVMASGLTLAQGLGDQRPGDPQGDRTLTPGLFIQEAAQSGLAEVHLGELALDKAQAQEVKEFARRMIDDHTRLNTQLQDLAQAKDVAMPAAPAPEHDRLTGQLRNQSGHAFDHAYMTAQVESHERMVRLFEQAQQGQDIDLRSFASSQLRVLRGHLAEAQGLLGTGTPTAQQQ